MLSVSVKFSNVKKSARQLLMLMIVSFSALTTFAQPANDEPCNAIDLTPGATCSYATYTNAAATASAGVPAPGCANYLGGDVWFKVVVPASGSLRFDTQAGVITDGGMAIYNGTSCSNLTLIECDDDDSPNGLMSFINATGLTPTSTVWIRIWEYGNDNNGTFGICVSFPPPPPTNDDPCTAIDITAGTSCNYTTYSNEGASGSTGVTAPGCANYQGGDVWFKVTVPCGGALTFDTQTGFITDGGMAIYSGTSCSALTLIECDDDDSQNGLMPRISATNLVPGSTVWVRVWEYGNDNQGTFGLCITIPPPPGPAGSCSTALPFCTSNVYTFPNNTNVPSLGGSGIYGCLFTTPNPVWYYMQVQNTGSITIGISQTSNTGAALDVDFALWGPFPTLAASCGGLTAANNISCSYSISNTETAQISNAQAGEFYILLLTNYSNQSGTITFQQSGGTGTSSCAIICNTTASNSGPVCGGATFNLTSGTVANATYLWTGPDCFTSTQQNPTGVTAPTTPGTYVYTVTATTPSGSSCTATTTVTVGTRPSLGADSTRTICAGSTADLTNVFNTTGLTATWTYGGLPVTNITSVSLAGIYELIAANTTGCKDTALFTLVLDTVSSTAASVNADCTTDGTITVTNVSGIAPLLYAISTNPGVNQSSNIFQAPAGSYVITTTDNLGCTGTTPVTVLFTDNLNLTGRLDTTICKGQSVTLNTQSNATGYSWSPATALNNPASANPVASPVVPTTYVLTATLGSCTKTDEVFIGISESVTVDAGQPIFIIVGDKATIFATAANASSYLWTPATGLSSATILNPVAQPTVTTLYSITATNALGCTATDDVLITVIPYCIKVKNAFTPNGDGINDLWLVYDQYDCLKNVTVSVFNRYGNQVYESKDYRNNWDGRYKGKSLPDATYYAVLEFTLISGKKTIIKSDVSILR